ncbi:DUF6445 family protein [Cellvibrio sp. NN19]|uniref:DUF6445 family protein n=1 Tax=Cellvibrio chitinivorans TaxID=3102792 RepID=UPI002B403ED6|nr:DUF6445 family protein [Cellvibrio sp. NN19]
MKSLYSLNENLQIKSFTVGNEQKKIIVIDDLLQQPQTMVDIAAQSIFNPYPGYENKKGYPGIRAPAPQDYSYNITTFLEPIIKRELQIPAHLNIRKSPCSFSLLTMQPETLGPLQRTPHFDSSNPHHIAVLLYLCDEHHGGTAFYRHVATGLDQITATTREQYLDVCYDELNTKRPKADYIKDSTELYTKIGSVQAKFNRLVIYKGSILHAPFIESNISVDSHPRTGRLTVNTFYDF